MKTDLEVRPRQTSETVVNYQVKTLHNYSANQLNKEGRGINLIGLDELALKKYSCRICKQKLPSNNKLHAQLNELHHIATGNVFSRKTLCKRVSFAFDHRNFNSPKFVYNTRKCFSRTALHSTFTECYKPA